MRISGAVNTMGSVAVILKVMPESPDVDLAGLQAEIRKTVPGVNDMRAEPIGFGLSAIKIAMIAEDEEGAEDKILGLFSGIADIDRVEIESLNRML
jgi:elongation factor 1-beta